MGSRGPAKGCGGRPRKPLAEKLLEREGGGNRSKRPIKVLKQFDEISSLEAADVPEPSLYLSQLQKDGKPFGADEIYKRVWLWLKERKCEKFVSSDTIEHYAVMAARAVQCTRSVSEFGLLLKGSKGEYSRIFFCLP